MAKPKIGAPIPDNLGRVVDLYTQVREYRLAEQKKVDEIDAYEKELRKALIDGIPKSDLTGVAGKLARATIVPKEAPQVEDWDAFYKYVKRTGAFDLMQRRLNDKAIRERWDAKKEVPGVKHFPYKDISISRTK